MGNAFSAVGRGISKAASGVGRALSGGGARAAGAAGGTAWGAPGVGNTLTELVVQAPSRAAGSGLSSALTRAIPSAVGTALSATLLNRAIQPRLANFTPGRTGVPEPDFGTPPSSAAYSDPTEVSEVVVEGQRQAPAPALANIRSSVVPSLINFSPGRSAVPEPTFSPPMANLGGGDDNTISELVVQPPRRQPDADDGGAYLPFMAMPGEGFLPDREGVPEPDFGEEEEEGDPEAEAEGRGGILDLLGNLLPLALMGGLPGMPGFGRDGNDLTAPGTPGGNLNDLAGRNAQMANMLGERGLANLGGDIGGKGMRYIDRMVKKAQAAIRQRYAGMGMSGSSAEQADLNGAAEAGVDMQFKAGAQMAQTGLQAMAALTGQSASIYASLLNAQVQRDTALGNAQAEFMSEIGVALGQRFFQRDNA